MVNLKPISLRDTAILWEMFYHAIYIPPDQPPLPFEIVNEPELRGYVEGWGRDGDIGIVAWDDTLAVGASWVRLWTGEYKGYGYMADDIPELSIALLPEYRGQGIGTYLIQTLLNTVREVYSGVSLSVSPGNPAVHLYERLGFKQVKSEPDSLVMVYWF